MVLGVDEKTGIPALDRTQPLLPLRAKKPRSGTNEDMPHGTQTLIAALEMATGKVVPHIRNRRTSLNFFRFLNDVVRAYPDRELHVVADNLNIHKNEAARRWLNRHPRVRFHSTPTHASWERSKQDLKALLQRFLANYNAPFTWTKGPAQLQRIIESTKEYQAAHPRKSRRRPKRSHADSIRD